MCDGLEPVATRLTARLGLGHSWKAREPCTIVALGLAELSPITLCASAAAWTTLASQRDDPSQTDVGQRLAHSGRRRASDGERRVLLEVLCGAIGRSGSCREDRRDP